MKVVYGTVVAADIKVPELTGGRRVNQEDIDMFVDQLRESGYDTDIGAIKVHYKVLSDGDGGAAAGHNCAGGSSHDSPSSSSGNSGGKVAHLIDGAHRLAAYLQLHQAGAKGFESGDIVVQVYTRSDGKELSAADVLLVSCALGDTSHPSVPQP